MNKKGQFINNAFFGAVFLLLAILIYFNGFSSVVSDVTAPISTDSNFDPLSRFFYSNVNFIVVIILGVCVYVYGRYLQ